MRQLLNKFVCQASAFLRFNSTRQFSRCSTLYSSKNNDDSDATKAARSKIAEARELMPKKYKVFDDMDTEIIFDDSINLDVILNQKQQKTKPVIDRKNVSGLRGKKGVFDIEELVVLLREEHMRNIATIKVPKEMKYCEYMVLCNATSTRHIKTFLETLNKLYKIKKNKHDPFLNMDDSSKDWRLVDMDNIILNVFLEETRNFYDIETLWTVGEAYDDQIHRPDNNVVQDILDKHISFIEQQAKCV